MSEIVQSIKVKIVSNFLFSILLLIQHNFIISRPVVYKYAFVVRRQRADPSTKNTNEKVPSRSLHRVFVYFIIFIHLSEIF